MGPAFPEIPVGTESLLGLELMGAEVDAYNFAANLWTLHYLRLTNQLTMEVEFKVTIYLCNILQLGHAPHLESSKF